MRVGVVVATGGLVGLLAALLPATAALAATTQLKNPAVTPTTGTTATVFQFSVQFQPGTETSSTVTVSVASVTFALARTGGSVANQIWTGSRTLPAGSWTATFRGTTTSGTNPDAVTVSPIVVSAPTPAPTPSPTPVPTARPTAAPTPRPGQTATPKPGTTPAPVVSPTPFGTTVNDPSASPGGSALAASPSGGSASPSPSGSPAGDGAATPGRPLSVPLEGVVAIGLLGAVAVAAAIGERRRRQAVEAFRAAAMSDGATPVGADQRAEAQAEEWQADVVEDERVGTIEYEPPDGVGEPSDDDGEDPRVS